VSYGVGFNVIAGRQSMHEVVEIVDDQDESNGAGEVTKQARGGGFQQTQIF
jgi:hypothetical protein